MCPEERVAQKYIKRMNKGRISYTDGQNGSVKL